jgi:putative DNA primase/helicase
MAAKPPTDDGRENSAKECGPSTKNMTPEEMREAVESRVAAEAALIGDKAKDKNWEPASDDRFIRDCLYAEELGDGLLYAALHQGQFIFNASSSTWMVWDGIHWSDDLHDRALAAVEDVADVYRGFAGRCADKIKAASQADLPAEKIVQDADRDLKKSFKRVNRLHTDRRRCSGLKFARSNKQLSLTASGEEFDTCAWLIAVRNAVIDLRWGEPVKAIPGQMISKASTIDWRGIDCPAPIWEQFLLDVFEENRELVAFVWRLLGYCITGETREHILPVFWGTGRNGKGTIVEVLKFVLGDLAGPIQAEMLLDQGRGRSSAAPSPDIMLLRGLRLAYASETDRGSRFSPARCKWLTGADSLVGRWPHDRRPVTFRPTHKLLLLTNNKPAAPPEDFAFWERCLLVPFRLSYVARLPEAENERRADLCLRQRLEGEASGILAWLVRGCLEWQRVGLGVPDIVRDATVEYRRDDDFLSDWIEERCLITPDGSTRSGVLYQDFEEWFQANWSQKVPSPVRFSKMLRGRFPKSVDSSNCRIFLGIKLNPKAAMG